MAKKAKETIGEVLNLEPIQRTYLKVELIGDSDLILHGMDRYTTMKMIWEREHPENTPLPAIFQQDKTNPNIWQQLITSIHWLHPIEFHDEDISLYSQEEWERYMKENTPCILSRAFLKSFKEVVISFYKYTKLKGTDLRRSINITNPLCPVTFENVEIRKSIANTREDGGGSPVLSEANVFSGWKTEIEIKAPATVFPTESILAIIQSAGEFIGIGTQRANGYGRYHIGSVQEIR